MRVLVPHAAYLPLSGSVILLHLTSLRTVGQPRPLPFAAGLFVPTVDSTPAVAAYVAFKQEFTALKPKPALVNEYCLLILKDRPKEVGRESCLRRSVGSNLYIKEVVYARNGL